MENQPLHIKFQNQYNPRSGFDLLALNELFERTNLDHSPYDHHLVEFFIIIFIRKGKGKHSIDFIDYDYSKGTLFTIRRDQIQKFYPNPEVDGHLLLFTTDFLVSFLERQESEKTLQLFNELLGSPKLQLSEKRFLKTQKQLKRIQEEYFEIHDGQSLGIIRSELQILIARLFRIKAQHDAVLYSHKHLSDFIRFQQLVEQNVTQYSTVAHYASEMGISTKSLNKITSTAVHKTAKAFLDEVHLKQIKRLLINSNRSIKEIAYESGFEEPTNFYKFFKRQTDLTPEQFRNTL
ncbi:MAG: helix-turn-helix domain-containing protein [Bacteroidota bacterium]